MSVDAVDSRCLPRVLFARCRKEKVPGWFVNSWVQHDAAYERVRKRCTFKKQDRVGILYWLQTATHAVGVRRGRFRWFRPSANKAPSPLLRPTWNHDMETIHS